VVVVGAEGAPPATGAEVDVVGCVDGVRVVDGAAGRVTVVGTGTTRT
jgi:hypothetical protein